MNTQYIAIGVIALAVIGMALRMVRRRNQYQQDQHHRSSNGQGPQLGNFQHLGKDKADPFAEEVDDYLLEDEEYDEYEYQEEVTETAEFQEEVLETIREERHETVYEEEETGVSWQTTVAEPIVEPVRETPRLKTQSKPAVYPPVMTLMVIAQPGRQFVGYELLQALSNAQLVYGDMQIFHRFKNPNNEGPVLFSVASATEPGTFDMQNMGRITCRGLCLFLRLSPTTDNMANFDLMLATAQQLAEDLHGVLRDDKQQEMNDTIIADYRDVISDYAFSEID